MKKRDRYLSAVPDPEPTPRPRPPRVYMASPLEVRAFNEAALQAEEEGRMKDRVWDGLAAAYQVRRRLPRDSVVIENHPERAAKAESSAQARAEERAAKFNEHVRSTPGMVDPGSKP